MSGPSCKVFLIRGHKIHLRAACGGQSSVDPKRVIKKDLEGLIKLMSGWPKGPVEGPALFSGCQLSESVDEANVSLRTGGCSGEDILKSVLA